MSSLRTCAAVLAVAVSYVLVGCVAEGTVDQQEQDQTSTGATTFGATVSANGGENTGRHAPSIGHTPVQSQEQVVQTTP